jgi:hypothetical protein
MELPPEHLRTLQIFFPHAYRRTVRAINENQLFVHYSDASAALSMIRQQEVWMRNVTWMNDSSEINHGIECLSEAYKGPIGSKLREILDSEFSEFSSEFDRIFFSWLSDFKEETYVTCLTEELHNEKLIGRLSMWRAYGRGNAAVAFVLNGGPFLRPSDALSAYTSPVAYLDLEGFFAEFKSFVEGLERSFDWLVQLGRSEVLSYLFNAFKYAVICTKHPAFWEEREWRIVYQPNFDSAPKGRIIEDYTAIGGLAQRIFKIPLRDYPDEGLCGVTLQALLVRLIIGPGPQADNLRREFVRLLESAGIADAHTKVVVSGVPLRY